MERRCRLSAAQAELRSTTCIRGTSASASATGIPSTRLVCHRLQALPPLASCAALEPRPTHHPPLVSSSPSARSGIRRDCAAGTHRSRPERPALTLTLIASAAGCEQDKLIVKLAERKRFVTITK